MRFAHVLVLCGILACNDGTSSDGPDDEVIDRMTLTDVETEQPATYVVADHWAAFNAAGRELPLVDTAGIFISRGIRWSLDSLPVGTTRVNSAGVIALEPGFVGRLYLFAPTARAAVELMGFHFVSVQ